MKNKSGLLSSNYFVVIAIIAIIATITVVALQNSRANARDAKRLADVKQMQTALELYFNDNNSYPTSSITSTIATSNVVYMTSIPTPLLQLMEAVLQQLTPIPILLLVLPIPLLFV